MDHENSIRSNDKADNYRSVERSRSHSTGQSFSSNGYGSKLNSDDIDYSTVKSSQNYSTKTVNGYKLPDQRPSSRWMSAFAAADRRKTINVFPETETLYDRIESPLTTSDLTEINCILT